MIVVSPDHRLASLNAVHPRDLTGERYLNRISCEFYGYAGAIWRENGFEACEMVYRSERDDWILAMIAAGLGFGFMPQSCVKHPMVVARPIVDPEFWREVNLVTVRGRPHSPAVGALVTKPCERAGLGGPRSRPRPSGFGRRRARSRLGRIGAMRRQTAELSPSRAASRSRGLEIDPVMRRAPRWKLA